MRHRWVYNYMYKLIHVCHSTNQYIHERGTVATQHTSWRTCWARDTITAVPPLYSILSRQSREWTGRAAVSLHSKVKEDKCHAKNGKVDEVEVVHSLAVEVFTRLRPSNAAVAVSAAVQVLLYYTRIHKFITFRSLLLSEQYSFMYTYTWCTNPINYYMYM